MVESAIAKPAIVKPENLMPVSVGSVGLMAYDAWSPRWGRDSFLEQHKLRETEHKRRKA